jgi:prolipoprotein diacylglyceryltransferase
MTLAAPLHWGPDPNLLEWEPLPVRWYGLFFTSGFLLGPMLVGLFAARFSFFCAHFLRARQRGGCRAVGGRVLHEVARD